MKKLLCILMVSALLLSVVGFSTPQIPDPPDDPSPPGVPPGPPIPPPPDDPPPFMKTIEG